MTEEVVNSALPPPPPPKKPKRKRDKLLKAQVLKQLEFYFGDVNLHKSRFMKEKMFPSESPNGNPIQIATLMTFNKLMTMGATPEVIKKCVKDSSLLRLGDDGNSIARTRPIEEPTNVDERTIYVENIPSSSTHDSLREIFSKFGVVDYVSLPKFQSTGDIKGFAFVEFAAQDSARRACGDEGEAEKKDGADDALPEVKRPAVMPRMNRAMARLAEAKNGEEEEEEEKKVDVTKEEKETAKGGEEGKDANDSSTMPSKRRRTMSEGEELGGGEAEGEAEEGRKVKRLRRPGRTRSISLNEASGDDETPNADGVGARNAAAATAAAAAAARVKDENPLPTKKSKRKKSESESIGETTLPKKKKMEKQQLSTTNAAAAAAAAPADGTFSSSPSFSKVEKRLIDGVSSSSAAAALEKKDAEKRKKEGKKEKKGKGGAKEGKAGEGAKDETSIAGGNRAREPVAQPAAQPATQPAATEPKEKKKPKNRRKKKKVDNNKKKAAKKKAGGVSAASTSTPKMTVMPKTKWVALRNEYLALQRQRMSALKQNLANAKIEERVEERNGGESERDGGGGVEAEEAAVAGEKTEARAYEKVPGLIVKVRAREEDHGLPPRSLIKSGFEKEFISPSDATKGTVSIAYMDTEEGQLVGHIRCSTADSASRIMELGLLNFDVSLLSGKDEDDYWEKLRLDRESRKKAGSKKKKKKPNRPNNGFKRIVDRASAAAEAGGGGGGGAAGSGGTHMRFEED